MRFIAIRFNTISTTPCDGHSMSARMANLRVTTGRSRSGERRLASIGRRLWRTYWTPDLFRFLAFGGTAALANLLAGWLLYGARLLPGIPYWGATATAAAIGLV